MVSILTVPVVVFRPDNHHQVAPGLHRILGDTAIFPNGSNSETGLMAVAVFVRIMHENTPIRCFEEGPDRLSRHGRASTSLPVPTEWPANRGKCIGGDGCGLNPP